MSIRAKKFAEVLSKFLKNNPNEGDKVNRLINATDFQRKKKQNSFQTRLKYKKGETSYSKLSDIRYISISLASSQTIRKWAQKKLPNGKILGLVTSADTLHYKTFKPLKGGLFCERIFGPLRDFECACGIQKRPTLEEYQKIVQHEPVERKFCSACDVEYTWSIIRRYQLGYIKLVSPVGHIWYSKGQPNYLTILLDWKRNDLDSFFYCTASSTLEESLQIFNNPFRVDPGFTNPLFDVDWMNFIKPSQLKTVGWAKSVAQASLRIQKFKNLQEQKRSILKPEHYQKLDCYFLKNKLHYFSTSFVLPFQKKTGKMPIPKRRGKSFGNTFLDFSTNFKEKENAIQKVDQNVELSLESTMPFSVFYSILLKKAMNLIYKKAYFYAHKKVKQKFFASANPGLLKEEFQVMPSVTENKTLQSKQFLNLNSKKFNKMFSSKTNQEKFLYWFQKQLMQNKNLHKNRKLTLFQYKLFMENLNKNEILNLNKFYTLFFKNKKLFISIVGKDKQHKAKKMMPLTLTSSFQRKKKHNFIFSKQKEKSNKTIENVVKQILWSRLKEPTMFLFFQNNLKLDLEAPVVRYFFNKHVISRLNFVGEMFSNVIFYNILKLAFEYYYKKFYHLNILIKSCQSNKKSLLLWKLLLTKNKTKNSSSIQKQKAAICLWGNEAVSLREQLEIIKWALKKDTMEKALNLYETKLIEKEITVKDLFFLREKIRNKKLYYLTAYFPYYKSNSSYNINCLLSNLRFILISSKNKHRLQKLGLFDPHNSYITEILTYVEESKKELEKISNGSYEKAKYNKILCFLNPTLFINIKKRGIFYQNFTNIKSLKIVKLTQTIAKKTFFWKFGFVFCKNYSTLNNNKTLKVQKSLLELATKLVPSIIIANRIKEPKTIDYKTRFNLKIKPEGSAKSKVVQAYKSIVRNKSFLLHTPLITMTPKNELNKKTILITGQNRKLVLFHTTQLIITNDLQINKYLQKSKNDNKQRLEYSILTSDKFFSYNKINIKNELKMNQILENWVKSKFFESFLNKRLLRFQYGFNAFSGRKPVLRNSIYLLSSRERDFFYEEKRPVYFINYCRGYSNFDDIWLPIYQFKGLENRLITLTGTSILQRFLQEFDDLKELSKMEKQYRVHLLAIEQKIRQLKILGSFFMSIAERRQLEKFIKKQVYFLRKTKIIRKLFVKESKLSSTLLTTLPVLPPDLRPILKMQGQVAASDLNRLYQRVIYRNDMLRKLKKTSGCLPTDLKYAQRLLQEAVDNLIQNGKSGGSPEVDSRGRSLKSLSELLKGKQGRFRQNLLGKRVDYSGRSVIVVGPSLKIHECGLPKEIAVELFLPFLIQRILHYNFARTVVGAKSLIKSDSNLCSFLLAELMQSHPIYLNRAPTLHRLGIQAFQPKLIEGRAILLHPLVCPAFNADFDGDQMAVHLPLTVEARAEAWKLMLSRNHLISAGTGNPVMLPSQDMVLGCYYLTTDTLRPTPQNLSASFLFPSTVSKEKSIVSNSLSEIQKTKQKLIKTLKLLLNFNDFKNIVYFESQHSKNKSFTDNMKSETFIFEKNHNQISLMLKKSREQRFSNQNKINFSRYFNNFEQVTKAYFALQKEYQKLKIHSDIWVNWKNPVETFSPKSRAGKLSPLEVQVHCDGSWNEIRYKHIRHFTKDHTQMTQYIRTTPGRVLFYNFIQSCIQNN